MLLSFTEFHNFWSKKGHAGESQMSMAGFEIPSLQYGHFCVRSSSTLYLASTIFVSVNNFNVSRKEGFQ
jgi:hypothetical protein